MPFPPALNRPRVLVALGVSLALGVVVGTSVNVFAGTRLVLPDDAVLPEYADAAKPTAVTEAGQPEGAALPEVDSIDRLDAGSVDKRRYVESIVRRNIFDSAANPASEIADSGSQDCRESSSRLVATVVADLPEYSSALIGGNGKSDGALDYKIGDSVGSEGRITFIDQKKVCLDGGGCICMGQDAKALAAVATTGDAEGGEGGVTKLSDTKFLVDKSFLEKQLGNVEQLATQIRASPKTEDGQIVGFRLSAIRKGTVFDKLGIKNGDVVHTVNGASLTSMETAMSAYGSLQNERGFTFEVTRRNQKMMIEYEVR